MIQATRDQRRELERQNAKFPRTLVLIPLSTWPATTLVDPRLIEVWRSREFLVQVFQEDGGVVRLTVCRTAVTVAAARWEDGITWDELQRLKRECGRGAQCAVEVYPGARDIVDVANMRHLWVLPEPPAYTWRRA